MTKLNEREITSGLLFPEGPIALADGSVLVVEIMGERLTRVLPDGSKNVIAPSGPSPSKRPPSRIEMLTAARVFESQAIPSTSARSRAGCSGTVACCRAARSSSALAISVSGHWRCAPQRR